MGQANTREKRLHAEEQLRRYKLQNNHIFPGNNGRDHDPLRPAAPRPFAPQPQQATVQSKPSRMQQPYYAEAHYPANNNLLDREVCKIPLQMKTSPPIVAMPQAVNAQQSTQQKKQWPSKKATMAQKRKPNPPKNKLNQAAAKKSDLALPTPPAQGLSVEQFLKSQSPLTAEDQRKLDTLTEKETQGTYLAKVEILPGETHSFDSLFGRYMDEKLTTIRIVETYLMSNPQMHNFFHFLEVCVVNSPSLRLIHLITKLAENAPLQLHSLKNIAWALGKKKIVLRVEFDCKSKEKEHDRSIVFDNGHVFKIGRGLDFFQKDTKMKFFLGMHDQRLLPCKKTTLNIEQF